MTFEAFMASLERKAIARDRPLIVKVLAVEATGRALAKAMHDRLGFPVDFVFKDGSEAARTEAHRLNAMCDHLLANRTAVLLVCWTRGELFGTPDLSSRADVMNEIVDPPIPTLPETP